jgi:hypothetical protein
MTYKSILLAKAEVKFLGSDIDENIESLLDQIRLSAVTVSVYTVLHYHLCAGELIVCEMLFCAVCAVSYDGFRRHIAPSHYQRTFHYNNH